MFKLTIECATVAELQALVAQLGGEAPKTTTPKSSKTTSTPASPPEEKPAETTSTPEVHKDETTGFDFDAVTAVGYTLTGDDLRAAADVSLEPQQFSKLGIKFAKALNDNGAKAKEIWKGYTKADGGPVQKFSDAKPDEFGKMLNEMADALDEAAMA